MDIRHSSFFVPLLVVMLLSDPVRASDVGPFTKAPGEMTQEEYVAYRARIRQQMEAVQQAENKEEVKATMHPEMINGYGQGYRARQERAADNGAMGRAGGRGR